MTDTRLASKGNIRFRFHPEGSFANPYWPTVVEMNAGQELEGVTLWENFEVGAQASETSDTAPIKAKAAAARRAGANFGGTASFWYAGDHTNLSNLASLVYAIMKEVNRPGYLSVSVDGEIGEPGQPNGDFTYAHGDYVSIYKIMTDEWDDSITGEEAFYYTRTFLKNGMMRTYTVVSTAAPVLTLVPTAVDGAAGGIGSIKALVNGRDWTRGVRWASTDLAVATVSPSGIVDRIATGTADISASLPRTNPGVSATEEVTVS